jgi:hypothetical protein
MARELPRLIRTRLETTLFGASQLLESQIQSQLVDLVRICQSELFRRYPQYVQSTTAPSDDPIPSMASDPANLAGGLPIDMDFDLSAWFVPPTVTDTCLQIPSEVIPNSGSQCPASNGPRVSDSAHGTQSFSTGPEREILSDGIQTPLLESNLGSAATSQPLQGPISNDWMTSLAPDYGSSDPWLSHTNAGQSEQEGEINSDRGNNQPEDAVDPKPP